MTGIVLTTAMLGMLPAQGPQTQEQDVVLRWNEVVVAAIRADHTPPPLAARNLAIVHAAVYDAVNAVHGTHQPYRVRSSPPPGTSAETAAAVAAHRSLVALYPTQVTDFDAALDESFAGIPDGPGRAAGVELGQAVAEKMLDWRRGDRKQRTAAYARPSAPGVWLPTPPDYRPPMLPSWGSVRCFALRSGSQFRPSAPPALTSADYATGFEEVRALGGARSAVRTPEQTEIARFWEAGVGTGTPSGHWNDIARTVARARGLTMADNARLFALLNLTLADAGIACWDSKYQHNFWRPVHAIRATDPTWEPLLLTPPFPAYTSGHSTFSAAGATALAAFFGRDDIPFSTGCDPLPNVKRSYRGFWAAAQEAGLSRIYGGIHWNFDNTEGLECGRLVGEYVSRHFLLPL